MVRALRGVSLRYADTWIDQGFPLSEDLPLLRGHEFLPQERDTAVGAVDDARPDRWGERVIRLLDKPPRLSLLEYLYLARQEIHTVIAAVATWRQHFTAAGVSASDIEMLGEHIDRPFLREQRDDFAA